jgi:hypothetical protein
MQVLTDKPTGSVIDVTLSWPAAPDSRLWRYVDRLLMVLWLCGWARALVWPAGQLANGNLDFFLVSWSGFWTLCGGLCAWALLASFRPPRPESVRLESGGLQHDPGGRSRCWGGRQRRGPIRVARSDVRGFVLESVEGRSRLYVDRGIDRWRSARGCGSRIGSGCSRSYRGGTRRTLRRSRRPSCWFLEVPSRRRPLLSVVVIPQTARTGQRRISAHEGLARTSLRQSPVGAPRSRGDLLRSVPGPRVLALSVGPRKISRGELERRLGQAVSVAKARAPALVGHGPGGTTT